jgi:hypothetical protein
MVQTVPTSRTDPPRFPRRAGGHSASVWISNDSEAPFAVVVIKREPHASLRSDHLRVLIATTDSGDFGTTATATHGISKGCSHGFEGEVEGREAEQHQEGGADQTTHECEAQ